MKEKIFIALSVVGALGIAMMAAASVLCVCLAVLVYMDGGPHALEAAVTMGVIGGMGLVMVGSLGVDLLRPMFREIKKAKAVAGTALVALVAGLIFIDPALAADGWEEKATGLIDDLNSGLVKIGAPVVGIGIIAFGLWGAMTMRIDWMRFGMIVIAGLLITVGPEMVESLLGFTR